MRLVDKECILLHREHGCQLHVLTKFEDNLCVPDLHRSATVAIVITQADRQQKNGLGEES